MHKIIYIIPKNRPNFTNFYFKKENGILDTQINQKRIIEIKKKKLIPYALHKANYDKLLHNNIKVITWNDHPFSISNSYDHFLKKYDKFLKDRKLFISTFDCYKHLIKNFIPHYPPKFFQIKIKKKLFYKKKNIDIIFLSGDIKIKFYYYIKYFSIYLISLYFWKKNIFLKKIFKNPLARFVLFFSFGSLRVKYFTLMTFMKNLRRRHIKKELEDVGGLNIFYSGNKKFCPSNTKNILNWIDERNYFKIFNRSKLIIVTESFCNEPNERIFSMKYGCLPILEDNLWIKKKK